MVKYIRMEFLFVILNLNNNVNSTQPPTNKIRTS